MDHAPFCRGVVCRGVPGINTVIIGAVPALCETPPYVRQDDRVEVTEPDTVGRGLRVAQSGKECPLIASNRGVVMEPACHKIADAATRVSQEGHAETRVWAPRADRCPFWGVQDGTPRPFGGDIAHKAEVSSLEESRTPGVGLISFISGSWRPSTGSLAFLKRRDMICARDSVRSLSGLGIWVDSPLALKVATEKAMVTGGETSP